MKEGLGVSILGGSGGSEVNYRQELSKAMMVDSIDLTYLPERLSCPKCVSSEHDERCDVQECSFIFAYVCNRSCWEVPSMPIG